MQQVEDQVLCRGDWLALNKRGHYEYVARLRCTGVVAIVPVTSARELVLVEQYRPAVNKSVIELPAGLVGDHQESADESFREAARRELLEETGFAAQRIEPLFSGPIASGSLSEVMQFFFADQLEWQHAGGGDETEDIRVHVVSLSGIHEFLIEKTEAGLLIDPKIYIGLYFAEYEFNRTN